MIHAPAGLREGWIVIIRGRHSGRQQRAITGHPPTVWRTGEFDPKRAFMTGPMNGRKRRESGRRRDGQDAQALRIDFPTEPNRSPRLERDIQVIDDACRRELDVCRAAMPFHRAFDHH